MKKKEMTTSSKHTAWLRYLRGELSDSESYDLENNLMKDDNARSTIESIAQNDLSPAEIEEDLSDIRQRWKSRSMTKNRSIAPWVSRVAAALFLGFGVWAAMQYYQDQQGSVLYANYFENDSYLAVRGGNDDNPSFVKALEAYETKNYESSFTQFQYLSEQLNDVEIQLYTALSAMQLGKNFEAKQILQEIKNLNIDEADVAPAYWYLALIYLQENKNKACSQELEWLIKNTPNGQWGSNATKLLEQL